MTDLEYLQPYQYERIIQLCQLSSVDDLAVAAAVLENHQWNIENALKELMDEEPVKKEVIAEPQKEVQEGEQLLNNWKQQVSNSQGQFQIDESMYHSLDNPQQYLESVKNQVKTQVKKQVKKEAPLKAQNNFENSLIIGQQNQEYQMMEKMYNQAKNEKIVENQMFEEKKKLLEIEKEEFLKDDKAVTNEEKIQIKFRLHCGSKMHNFRKSDTAAKIYSYVNCFLRNQMNNEYGEFDLTQTFPSISLGEKKSMKLDEIFGETHGEVLIVKQN